MLFPFQQLKIVAKLSAKPAARAVKSNDMREEIF